MKATHTSYLKSLFFKKREGEGFAGMHQNTCTAKGNRVSPPGLQYKSIFEPSVRNKAGLGLYAGRL